ncbi:MAG: tetratricopeptide repeat protein [bacterium]
MRMKANYILTIFLFLFATTIIAQEEVWFAKGEKAFYKKEYKDAIISFSEAIKIKKDMKEAYLMRGIAFLNIEDAEASLKDFSSYIQLDSTNPDVFNYRGLSKSYRQDVLGAIEDFKKAVALDSNFSQAYLNLGSAYLAEEDYDNGLTCLNKVVKLDKKNPENYFIRGTLFYLTKKYEDAIADFSKSIELGLKISKTYYNRANSYYKVGKYKEAISDFTNLLKLNPKDREALNNRAIAYDKAGMKDLAAIDRLTIAEILTGIEDLPDIRKLKYKKYSFLNNEISIEMPDNWFVVKDTMLKGEIMVISRDSIGKISNHYVAGARIATDSNMKEQYNVGTVEEILNFWEVNADSNSLMFKEYKLISKEPFLRGDYRGFIKKVRMLYDYNTFPILLYEIVLAKENKLIYAYFQSPEQRFDYYQKIFDKSLMTLSIKTGNPDLDKELNDEDTLKKESKKKKTASPKK